MASYTSFGGLSDGWTRKHSVVKARDEALKRGTDIMQDWVKEQHGGGTTAPASGRLQGRIKGHRRPLEDSGGLKRGVLKRKKNADTMEVYQKNTEWAHIHEYGATWNPSAKQSAFLRGQLKAFLGISSDPSKPLGTIRIPPRPIWSRAVKSKGGQNTKKTIKDIIRKHLTN